MNQIKKLLTLLSVFSILIFTGCGDDDEGLDPTSQMLIGVWETQDEIEFQVGIEGLTQEELDEYSELINAFLQLYAQSFFGTIEFKNDLTYTASFGEADTGTWMVTNEGKTLILNSNDEPEDVEVELISVGTTQLVLGLNQEEDTDVNGDGVDETFSIEIEMTLDKVN